MMSESQVSKQSGLASAEFKQKLGSLYEYLATKLGIAQSPLLKLISDNRNSQNPFGFTGHYDPTNRQIVLYITERHDTDILRSFAHEIIHHWQNERGTLHQDNPVQASGQGENNHNHYAQEDGWLRRREMEAYLFGNILFRDWQDEQRMGPPKNPPILPQPLDTGSESDGNTVRSMVKEFVDNLISSGIISSYHRDLTSGDMQPQDFSEDLCHAIMSSIENWIRTINNRGNRENDLKYSNIMNKV